MTAASRGHLQSSLHSATKAVDNIATSGEPCKGHTKTKLSNDESNFLAAGGIMRLWSHLRSNNDSN